MLVIATILFFGVLAWDVITDYHKWKVNRSVAHTKEAWIRAALLIPATTFFTVAHPVNSVWVLVNVLAMEFFVFWLLFDGLYNIIRGFKWWFSGSEDPDDPILDRLASIISTEFVAAIKIIGTAVSIFVYILSIFKHS